MYQDSLIVDEYSVIIGSNLSTLYLSNASNNGFLCINAPNDFIIKELNDIEEYPTKLTGQFPHLKCKL